MKLVYVGIKNSPHYRAEAFVTGLKKIGYVPCSNPDRADLLVLWNRIGPGNTVAQRAEKRGASVLVAENAYLGNDFNGEIWYTISRNHHNGPGSWPIGASDRWDTCGTNLLPFRSGGDYVLVLAQRGIGEPGVAMPRDWELKIIRKLELVGETVKIRRHPGVVVKKPLLLEQLEHAKYVVTWGSGAAVKALAYGIPVFYGLKNWVMAEACSHTDTIGKQPRADEASRLSAFRKMIWCQWRLDEISSGTAFSRLLGE